MASFDSGQGEEQAWLGWVEGQVGAVRRPWRAGIEMGRTGRREFFRRMARRLGLTLMGKKRGKGSERGFGRAL
jgi:hypothetical protein